MARRWEERGSNSDEIGDLTFREYGGYVEKECSISGRQKGEYDR